MSADTESGSLFQGAPPGFFCGFDKFSQCLFSETKSMSIFPGSNIVLSLNL